MAKYCETDFFPWDKPLMEELRREGKHIYTLIDTGGSSYQICKGGFVNRFGYMITDTELPLNEDDYLESRDFSKLKWEHDYTLKKTVRDISAEIEKSKQEYEAKEKEADRKWKKFEPYYNKAKTIERKYKFWLYFRHIDAKNYPSKRTTPYYEDGKEIVLQYVWIDQNTPEDKQEIGYFLLQNDKMITESKRITVKRNCRISIIFKAIEKAERLVRETN